MSEVYFCGSCRRQQQPSEGERCKICGKITVSWYTDRESHTDATKNFFTDKDGVAIVEHASTGKATVYVSGSDKGAFNAPGTFVVTI